MTWKHVRRYAEPKKRDEVALVEVQSPSTVVYKGALYDLLTGKKGKRFVGFMPTPDGRWFRWDDTTLVVHHADGREARIAGAGGMRLPQTIVVGPSLVFSADGRQPWTVADTATGATLGQLEGQTPDATFGTPLYNAVIVGAVGDGKLWLNEGTRIARFDIASRQRDAVVEAPSGTKFLGGGLGPDETLAVIVRPLERGFERSDDQVMTFTAAGARSAATKLAPMFVTYVGESLFAVDDAGRAFVELDASLAEVSRVPMFEPGKKGFARMLPLPGGQGWISIGGFGEWDHYGR